MLQRFQGTVQHGITLSIAGESSEPVEGAAHLEIDCVDVLHPSPFGPRLRWWLNTADSPLKAPPG